MIKKIVKIGNSKFIGLDKSTLSLSGLSDCKFVRISVFKNRITLSKPKLSDVSDPEDSEMDRDQQIGNWLERAFDTIKKALSELRGEE